MSLSGSLFGQSLSNDATINTANPVVINILIVDDSPVLRKLLHTALAMIFKKPKNEANDFNYVIKYQQAASGEAALDLIHAHIKASQANFDLIFLDNSMGAGISGIQTTLAIRSIEAKEKLVSSSFKPGCIIRFTTDPGITYPGEDAHISKQPLDRNNIIAVLSELPLFKMYPAIFNPSGSPLSSSLMMSPSPSPSPDVVEHKRATSAPPPKMEVKSLKNKEQSPNSEHALITESADEEAKEKDEDRLQSLHSFSSTSRRTPYFQPHRHSEPVISYDVPRDPVLKPLVKVDIVYTEGKSPDPLTVSIEPLADSDSPEETITLSAITGDLSLALPTLPTPPPAFTTNKHDQSAASTTAAALTTVTLLELFTNRPTNARVHSPVPKRSTLSPIVSRTTTPEQTDSPVRFVNHSHTRSLSREMQFNPDTLLATEQRISPPHSPHLGLGVTHGRNSPFKTVSPTVSPGNSPSNLHTRRLAQRHPLAHTHFADSSGKKPELEVEAKEDKTKAGAVKTGTESLDIDKSTGSGLKHTP